MAIIEATIDGKTIRAEVSSGFLSLPPEEQKRLIREQYNVNQYNSEIPTYSPDMSVGDAMFFAGRLGGLDTVRGLSQIVGYNEEKMSAEQDKLHELMEHPEYGNKVKMAYFGGLILDPAGWVLPVAKARTAWKLFKYGLGTGALVGGASYVDPKAQSLIGEGKLSRPEQAALGAAAGGVLAPAIGKGLQAVTKGYESRVGNKAWKAITKTPELGTSPAGALAGYNFDEDATTEDKMRNALMGALIGGGSIVTKFSPKGRELRQEVGRRVVPKFGLSGQYIHEQGRKMVHENRILGEFNDLVRRLQKLDEPTRKALYKIVVGEAQPDSPENAMLAKEVRETVNKYSKEMVDLGLLSKDTFEKNIETYLHRVYKRPKGAEEGLPPTRLTTDEKIHFAFDELKMRGEVRAMPKDEWEVDKTFYTDQGYEIIKDIDPSEFKGSMKSVPRIVIRRDWTPEERLKMGEIQDVAIGLERTGQLMANDISTARFYKAIADDFSLPGNASEELIKAKGFTKHIPAEYIGGTGRLKYGALSDRWVSPNVENDIIRIEKYRTGTDWTKALDRYKKMNTVWKTTKTVLNLPVHFGNVVSNMQVYDGLGGKWSHFRPAAVEMKDAIVKGVESSDYKAAKEYGVFGGGFVEHELGATSRKILNEYADTVNSVTGFKSIDATIDTLLPHIPDMLIKLGKGTKKWSLDALQKAYQAEDYVYRFGLWKTLMAEGVEDLSKRGIREGAPGYAKAFENLSIDVARKAREGFVDYSIKTPLLQALRHTALPFVAYMYGIIPRLGEIAVSKPWKMAKWALLWHGINSIGEELSPESKTTIDRQRELFGPGSKGTVYGMPGYIPKEIKVPGLKGPRGESAYWNIQRTKPGADIFKGTEPGGFDIPFLPEWLQPMGQFGAAGALARGAFGKRAFKDDPAPWGERPGMIAREFLPNVPIPGFPSYAGQKLERAWRTPRGFLSETKDAQTKESAILQSLGPKLHYADPTKLKMREYYRFKTQADPIRKQLRDLERDRREHKYVGKMDKYRKKKRELEDKLRKLAERYR
jgi:hypothetical protein